MSSTSPRLPLPCISGTQKFQRSLETSWRYEAIQHSLTSARSRHLVYTGREGRKTFLCLNHSSSQPVAGHSAKAYSMQPSNHWLPTTQLNWTCLQTDGQDTPSGVASPPYCSQQGSKRKTLRPGEGGSWLLFKLTQRTCQKYRRLWSEQWIGWKL